LEIKPLPVQDSENLKYVPSAYKKVAGDLESQFNEFMLEQMSRTVDHNEEASTAESYYDNLLTSERAKTMSSSDKGIGLKKIILDQIYPQRIRNEANLRAQEQAQEARASLPQRNKIKIYAQGGRNE
jgi:Rod binding domain-containing protein